MGKRSLLGIIGLAGLGVTGLALFAQKLGIARSNHWGFGRVMVLGTGLVLLLLFLSILTWGFWQKGSDRLKGLIRNGFQAFLRLGFVQRILAVAQSGRLSLEAGWNRFPPVKWTANHLQRPFQAALRNLCGSRTRQDLGSSHGRRAALAAVCLGVIIIATYVWFVSVGRWTDWPKTTNYYDRLAAAFWHGQPSLLEKPDPALARLDDPYDFNSRHGIPILWDVSYYNGKYFLYWGPAPALILMGARLFTAREIGDQTLVFALVSGTFLFSALLILALRKRLFPDLSWKYVLPAILIAGFANPLPWLLNRPAIYEAAIAGGQFFLMAGLFLCFTAIERQPPLHWVLALAGVCWVLAMSSRLTLTPAVLFLVASTGVYLVIQGKRKELLKYALAMGLPVGAGLAGMLWYNKIRFNFWFEFGLRYSLTGLNYHKYYNEAFSLGNFLPNFNNYLINPFRTLTIFPYVKPDWGGRLLLFYFKAPVHYFSEQVSGLIPTLPFIIISLIPIVYLLRAGWRRLFQRSGTQTPAWPWIHNGLKEWIFISLLGASFLAFLPILFFITANMRYLADVVPMLVLLSILGFWSGADLLAARPALRRLWIALVIVLVAYSIGVSLLLAVTGNEARFENLNPVLFKQLEHWLTP